MSTAGVTSKFNPQNSFRPVMYASGSRRFTAADQGLVAIGESVAVPASGRR